MDRAAGAPVEELVEHLFRHQAGRMLASLTAVLGLDNLDVAEDAVQEALLQALRSWPFRGIPENPRAWLAKVARNKALDALRRRASRSRLEQDLAQHFTELQRQPVLQDDDADAVGDDQLAMIFACCHPALPAESRVALTLKAVSGLSVPEIACAFLADETTIAQRLVRAKRRIREAGLRLHVPAPGELPERLGSVLQVLYLLFNEGYSAHGGANLIRADLCAEAIRLAGMLASHPATDAPEVHALLSLFCLQAARLSTRVDGDGNVLLLEDQDRSLWDQRLLRRGLAELNHAACGDNVSEYHIQAAIAAVHATSPSFASTDWSRLLDYYDQLLSVAPSPVVLLNRAIALSRVSGPEEGLRSLASLEAHPSMQRYRLLAAVRADMLRQLGRDEEACDSYRQALAFDCSEPERRYLERRLASLE